MASSASTNPFPRRHFKRHEHLARAAQHQDELYRIEDGWACQYRQLKDGRRQIVALFLPGDYCEPQWLFDAKATMPVVALTPVIAQVMPVETIRARPFQAPDGMAGVLRAMLSGLRNRERWIVNLGRMTATERICDLICEIFDRLKASGQALLDRHAVPLTQYDLADIAGISPVHVNRVLQMLREAGVIEWRARNLSLRDPEALRHLAGAGLRAETI